MDRRAAAQQRGEPRAVAWRHHLLEGLLRRLATLSDAGGFVLRGGLLVRAWLPGVRTTRDLDLVGDFPFDLAQTTRRLALALDAPVEDGLYVDSRRLVTRGMWLDTAFPGVRAAVLIGAGSAREEVTIDVGFGDPLVPSDVWINYPSLPAPIRAVRPETAIAWKLHGLAERGPDYRPKDLLDLWHLTSGVLPLDNNDLARAIEAAFLSRAFTITSARTTLSMPHWATKTARVRWTSAGRPQNDLASTLSEIEARLGEALSLTGTIDLFPG